MNNTDAAVHADKPVPEQILAPDIAAMLRWNADGLIPVVVQEVATGQVLMLAWMNDEALHQTLTSGRATYWSRSRQTYWVKGETSGHEQWVHGAAVDCDGDTLLLTVRQIGAACHTLTPTCFTDRDLPVTVTDPEGTTQPEGTQR